MVTASFNQKMRAFPEEIVNLMENGEITLLSPSSFTEPQWAWTRAGNEHIDGLLTMLTKLPVPYNLCVGVPFSCLLNMCRHLFSLVSQM